MKQVKEALENLGRAEVILSDMNYRADVVNQLDEVVKNLEDYEDYKPAEPLIKDEKVRKAVRAWAEANGIERVWHECASCWLRGNGLSIEMENEIDELEQGNYAIAELCGPSDSEEEE